MIAEFAPAAFAFFMFLSFLFYYVIPRVQKHRRAEERRPSSILDANWDYVAAMENDVYGTLMPHQRYPGIDELVPDDSRWLLGEGPPERWGKKTPAPAPPVDQKVNWYHTNPVMLKMQSNERMQSYAQELRSTYNQIIGYTNAVARDIKKQVDGE
jgi:hypothetical protein